jgi:glycosyltransferase involved in cell wall biosynthesis
MKVSVLILTHNEAINLPKCLDALTWCDDIIVVDSGSTDDTLNIAEGRGARVLHRPFDNFAAQRNFGLNEGQPKHDWVLHLDADEIVTSEFQTKLTLLEPQEKFDAYLVPSKTIFFGKWLKYAGMWPTYQVRLGHAERLRFVQVGHGQREDLPSNRLDVFDEAYLHFSFSHGLRAWLLKHVRYAQDEAGVIFASAKKEVGATAANEAKSSNDKTLQRRKFKNVANKLPLFLRPFARFFYVYILKQGFRDGFLGFFYSFMLCIYEGMIAILVYELRLNHARSYADQPSGFKSNTDS